MKLKTLFIISLLIFIPSLAYSNDKYIGVSLSYNNFQQLNSLNNHGGTINLTGYGISENFVFGGYGEVLLTKEVQLGKGGAIIGLGFTVNRFIHMTVTGKVGLGGGLYHGQSGSTYQYGGEIFFGFIRRIGIGVNLAYEIINNLYGMTNLGDSGDTNISIGLKLLL
jgi:hypothetical protein